MGDGWDDIIITPSERGSIEQPGNHLVLTGGFFMGDREKGCSGKGCLVFSAVAWITRQDSDGFLLRSIKITLRDEPTNNTSIDNRRAAGDSDWQG